MHYLGNLLLPLLILPLIYLITTQSNPLKFFVKMGEALLVNFGTASSISTFPVTLSCLTEKNRINQKVGKLKKNNHNFDNLNINCSWF